MTDPRDLRVSDDEREHVVGLLQKAMMQGLITVAEFESRSQAALAATTRSDLNALVVDLPGVVRTDAEEPPAKQRLELRSVMSKMRRRGQWVVPSELIVRSDQSACQLDFTVALIEHEVVNVELDLRAAHVKLILPSESTMDVADLQVFNCKFINKVRAEPRRGPKFVFTGKVRSGVLSITRPMSVQLGSLLFRFPLKIDRTPN